MPPTDNTNQPTAGTPGAVVPPAPTMTPDPAGATTPPVEAPVMPPTGEAPAPAPVSEPEAMPSATEVPPVGTGTV